MDSEWNRKYTRMVTSKLSDFLCACEFCNEGSLQNLAQDFTNRPKKSKSLEVAEMPLAKSRIAHFGANLWSNFTICCVCNSSYSGGFHSLHRFAQNFKIWPKKAKGVQTCNWNSLPFGANSWSNLTIFSECDSSNSGFPLPRNNCFQISKFGSKKIHDPTDLPSNRFRRARLSHFNLEIAISHTLKNTPKRWKSPSPVVGCMRDSLLHNWTWLRQVCCFVLLNWYCGIVMVPGIQSSTKEDAPMVENRRRTS